MIKLTDNMKFLLGFVVYISYASWWASGISSGVEANALASRETLLVLKDHMKECASLHEKLATVEERVNNNIKNIEILNNVIFIPNKPKRE